MNEWEPLCTHIEPPKLPVWDPQWKAKCLQCKHVHVYWNQDGGRVLRCLRAPMVRGLTGLTEYCIEHFDSTCVQEKWFEPAEKT